MTFIWIFLPIVFIGNALLQRFGGCKAANVLLLAASLFFYAWGEPVYILLMLVSITVNWMAGILIERFTQQRSIVLFLDIMINLALLGYFKYADMLVETWNALTHSDIQLPQIALPIGISFFTFQAMSYVIDVWRGECLPQKNWANLALYVSFFPQLIAGPIVKYKDISEQITQRSVTAEKTASGIRRFCYGFSKKILIANVLGLCADNIYGLKISAVSCIMAWIACLAYTLQIYYDFSGYSDMAIGLGKMFGFDFHENFRHPYCSRSIREFWRRWHISLSSWFRDYLYIPLGGNRKGTARTWLNLLIVFFCTGIWHGASWTFVFWGIFHGFFSLIERGRFGRAISRLHILSHIYTLLVVMSGWVFFRAETLSKGFALVKRMFLPWLYSSTGYSVWEFMNIHTVLVICIGIFGAGILQYLASLTKLNARWKYSVPEMMFCTVTFCLSLLSLVGDTYNPFIYFRF